MLTILTSKCSLILFSTAVILSSGAVFFTRFLALKFKVIEHGGYRKINRKPVPLLGGLGIALPFIGFLLLLAWQNDPIIHAVGKQGILYLALGCFGIVSLGMIDDICGMRARIKLLAQIMIAAFTVFVGIHNSIANQIYLPFVGIIHFSMPISGLISVFWIVLLINAFNLIDGLDGLATGVAFFVLLALAALAAIADHQLSVNLILFLAGSSLAFLFFNFNPASIFLGDTGSMFLGYIIAVLTLIDSCRYRTAAMVLAPIFALGLPIFEVVISMLRRYIRGLPVFVGDSYHTHHRLMARGYSQRQVVLLLYWVCFLLASWAVLERVIPSEMWWMPLLLFLTTLTWIAWRAGYLRLQLFKKVLYRRQKNILLNAFAKYAILSFNNNFGDRNCCRLLAALCCQELHLKFLKISRPNAEVLLVAGSQIAEPHFSNATEFKPISKEVVSKKTDQNESIKIDSLSGYAINIEYQFSHLPNEMEKHDVSICLANIFSQARII